MKEIVKLTQQELSLPRKRVMVYGSVMDGAASFSKRLMVYFQKRGVHDTDVHFVKNALQIEDTFFGLEPRYFYVDDLLDDPNKAARTQFPIRTLPIGVILFPEMRQYDFHFGGMYISTFGDKSGYGTTIDSRLVEMCSEYNVPLVTFREEPKPDKLHAGLKVLPLPKNTS